MTKKVSSKVKGAEECYTEVSLKRLWFVKLFTTSLFFAATKSLFRDDNANKNVKAVLDGARNKM